jgi:8-oxo-dGTP pyrophosphatase MutT (NUDIX family)
VIDLRWRLHRLALQTYRRLPVDARRGVVRLLNPTYTVGSLALIERDDGRILLIRQVYRRNWGLPGGMLKRNEAPADAAVREVAEEVGLAIEVVGRGTLVADLAPRRFDFIYRARPVDGRGGANGDRSRPGSGGAGVDELQPTSPELVAAAWFAKDALPELQFETRTALRAIDEPDALPYVVDDQSSSKAPSD